MNFYMKVLSKFANSTGLKINVEFEVNNDDGITNNTSSKINELRRKFNELLKPDYWKDQLTQDLFRTICFTISAMTDRFAYEQFEMLYGGRRAGL